MLLWIPLILVLGVYCFFELKAGEKDWNWKIATMLKVILSFGIAGCAWAFCLKNPGGLFSVLMALGLTLAVPADYFLQYMNLEEKRYTAGILFFALMHISLLVAYFTSYGVHLLEFILFAVFIACVLAIEKICRWKIVALKNLLTAYTAVVALMAAKSISLGILNPSPSTMLIALAGACFLASDIILGFWGYRWKRPGVAVANRVVYFAGQILFAYSLFLI